MIGMLKKVRFRTLLATYRHVSLIVRIDRITHHVNRSWRWRGIIILDDEIILRIGVVRKRNGFTRPHRLPILGLLFVIKLLITLARVEEKRVQVIDTMHTGAKYSAHSLVVLDETDGWWELTREAERDELELIQDEE